jgi:predicted lipid-binding transport protein (Tim44 family)
LASVEFSGLIREDVEAQAETFKEVWNMSLSKTPNSGWLVAGIQATT